MEIQQILLWVAYVAVAGWFLPPLAGVAGYDTHLFSIYAVLSVLFLSPMVCRGRSAMAGAAFGVFSSIVLVVVRVVAAKSELHAPALFLPDQSVLAATVVLSAGFSLAGAALATRLARSSESPRAAERAMRRGVLAVILGAVFLAKFVEPAAAALSRMLSQDRILSAAIVTALFLAACAWLLLRRAPDDPRYSSRFGPS